MTMSHPLKQYLPLLGAVFVVVLQSVYSALADDVLSTVEILNVIIALTAALTTYVIPRLEGGLAWAKPAVSAVAAGVMVLVDALSGSAGSITSATWVMALIQLVLGSGLVLLTQSNVPLTVSASTGPAVAVSPGVVEIRDEKGAVDSGVLTTILVVLAIIVVVIVLFRLV